MGFGKNEKVNSIGKIYLPIYIASYKKRNAGIVLVDDTLCSKKYLSIPHIFEYDAKEICNNLKSALSADDYISKLQSLIKLVKKVEKRKHEVHFVVAERKIISELDNFFVLLDEADGTEPVVSNPKTSKIDSEIDSILSLLYREDSKLDKLSSKIKTIESCITEITNNWIEQLEDVRIRRDNEYIKIINEMVDRFNNIILPQLEEEKDMKIAILQDRRDAVYHLYLKAKEDAKFYKDLQSHQAAAQAEKTASEYLSKVKSLDSEIKNVISAYNKAVKEEKSKIESKRKERQEMNKYYKSLESTILNLTLKFEDKSSMYISNVKNEMENIINEISVSLTRFKRGGKLKKYRY